MSRSFPYCGWTPFHRLIETVAGEHLKQEFNAKQIETIFGAARASSSYGHIQKALRDLGFIDSTHRATPVLERYIAAGGAGRKQILREQLHACYFGDGPPRPGEVEQELKKWLGPGTVGKALSFYHGAARWAGLLAEAGPPRNEDGSVITLYESPAASMKIVCAGNLLRLPDETFAIMKRFISLFEAMADNPGITPGVRDALDALVRAARSDPAKLPKLAKTMNRTASHRKPPGRLSPAAVRRVANR